MTLRAIWARGRCVRIAAKQPRVSTSGRRMKKPITERSSSTWKTLSSAVVARPATDIPRNEVIDSAIQNAALGIEGVGVISAIWQAGAFAAIASACILLGQLRRRIARRSSCVRNLIPQGALSPDSQPYPAKGGCLSNIDEESFDEIIRAICASRLPAGRGRLGSCRRDHISPVVHGQFGT